MKRMFFHPAARQELEDTIDYYDAERRGSGREFREEVQQSLGLSTRFP